MADSYCLSDIQVEITFSIQSGSMVDPTSSTICRCKIVKDRIVFCALHESAERLLATCDHLRKFLKNLKVAEQKDENMIREIILPYLDRQIAAAQKKSRIVSAQPLRSNEWNPNRTRLQSQVPHGEPQRHETSPFDHL